VDCLLQLTTQAITTMYNINFFGKRMGIYFETRKLHRLLLTKTKNANSNSQSVGKKSVVLVSKSGY
jgi:hypothetical protein